jgi:NitT/TauT family transport system ATP-binding protein
VDVGQIVGLMEMVLDLGGRANAFALQKRARMDFGLALAVVMAGELLGFLETPREIIVLTDLGRRFLAEPMNGRKAIFRQRLLTLPLFRMIAARLENAPGHQLPREVVEEELVLHNVATAETAGQLFDKIVAWGRVAELFGFSAASGQLYGWPDEPQAG